MAESDTDIARVRTVLARELDTINHYESLAAEAKDVSVRQFMLHLALEEKEHVAEAMALIRRLDLDQDKNFQADLTAAHYDAPKPPPQVALPERLPHSPERVVHAIPAPVGPYVGTLTVGPLKNRRGERHA
jgi:hypothetical protein